MPTVIDRMSGPSNGSGSRIVNRGAADLAEGVPTLRSVSDEADVPTSPQSHQGTERFGHSTGDLRSGPSDRRGVGLRKEKSRRQTWTPIRPTVEEVNALILRVFAQ